MTRPASAGALTGDRFPLASEATGVSGLAERYAAALFDLADERHELDAVAADLRELRAMLQQSGDLTRLLRSPVLSREEQGKAIAALAEARRAVAADARFPRRRGAQPAAVRGAGDDRGLSAAARRAPRRGHRRGHRRRSRSTKRGSAALTEQLRRAVGAPGGGRYPGRSGAARRHDRQGRLAHGRCVVEQPAAAPAAGDAGERLISELSFSSIRGHVPSTCHGRPRCTPGFAGDDEER